LKVRYFCAFGQKTGYAQASHDYLMALHRAGVDLCIRPLVDSDPSWMPERYSELIPLVNREDASSPNWPDVVVVHTIPHGLNLFVTDELMPPESVKRVALTTWETSKFTDNETIGHIKSLFDQLWVPSGYCSQAFVESGVPSRNVRIVPHTFDQLHWVDGLEHDKSDEIYSFYTILSWCERKNPVGLLKAYLTEFTEKDQVELRIRTPGFNHKEVDELARGLGLSYYPPVEMLTEHLTEEEMLTLHYASHCYVTCARSEGWGLGAFEALIVGNPVIATGYSGLDEFLCGAYNVERVPYFMTPAYVPETHSNSSFEVAGLKIKAINRNTHTGIRGDQEWAEPDLGTLKKLMRRAYEERWVPTTANRNMLKNRFSYESVGRQMKQLLENLVNPNQESDGHMSF
jgi:glycosyltransferase involved in cell wall biosynthesis